MADMEDILLGDEENPEPEPEPKRDAAAFAQMRRELKAMKQEAEELRAFKAQAEQQARTATVADVFKEVGLKPKHAKFYPTEGDVSPDAIKAWAVEEAFLEVEEGEEVPAPPKQETGFTPTVIGEGTPLGAKTYSFEEFEQLLQADPTKATRVWKTGLVAKQPAPGGSVFAGRDR